MAWNTALTNNTRLALAKKEDKTRVIEENKQEAEQKKTAERKVFTPSTISQNTEKKKNVDLSTEGQRKRFVPSNTKFKAYDILGQSIAMKSGYSSELSNKLGKFLIGYDNIAGNGNKKMQSSAVKMKNSRELTNFINNNKDVFDSYKRETGTELTIPGLLYEYGGELQGYKELMFEPTETKRQLPQPNDNAFDSILTNPVVKHDRYMQEDKGYTNRDARRHYLDMEYDKKVQGYYNTVNEPDFVKYSQSVNNDNTYTPKAEQITPGFNGKIMNSAYNRVNAAANAPVAKENKLRKYLDTAADIAEAGIDPIKRGKVIAGTIQDYNDSVASTYFSPETGEAVRYDMKNPEDVKLLYMTLKEKQIYNYYLAKHGYKEADKYLDYISGELDRRHMQAYAKNKENFANEHKIIGGAENIVSQFAQPTAAMDSVKQAIGQEGAMQGGDTESYRPYNPYAKDTAAVHLQSATEQGITRDMSPTGKKVADTALNVFQNASRLPLGSAGLAVMGAGVMGNTAVDAGLRGETSAAKVSALGAAYGAIEYATEKLPFEQIMGLLKAPPSTVRGFIGQILKNGGTEFGEELTSNVADTIADRIIMGDKSEYESYKKQLRESGLNAEEAERRAFNDFYIKGSFESGIEGAISGIIMGGGSAAVGTAVNNYNDTVNIGREMKDAGVVQDVINTGKVSDSTTSARRYADRLEQKQDSGRDLSDWNVGRQFQKNVKAIDAENSLVDNLANATGARAEIHSDLDGVNGRFISSKTGQTIDISANGDTSIPQTIKHEFTHLFEQNAPEAYKSFKSYILQAAAETNQEAVNSRKQQLKNEYESRNLQYTEELLNDEITAELTETFLRNPANIEKIANGNERFADKILDGIRTAKAAVQTKLSVPYENHNGIQLTYSQLNQAEKLWNNALRSASENKGQTSGENMTRYSPIEYDNDGRAYVRIDEDILDGVPKNEWAKTVRNVLREKFLSGIDYNGENVAVSGKSRKEFTQSKYTSKMNEESLANKFRMANNLDEVVNAQDNVTSENPSHIRNDDIVGFERGKARITVGNYEFEADVLLANKDDGTKQFYDVVNLNEIKIQRNSHTGRMNNANTVERNNAVSNNSILENGENVKYSVKESTNQTGFSSKDLAGQLISEYGAKIKKNEVAADIDEIRRVLASDMTDGAPSEAASNTAWELSERLADKITDSISIVDNDMYDTYADLRRYLKTTPIKYYDDYKSETGQFEDYNELRKKSFGLLRLSNNGVGIDSVYKELSGMYPNFFNEDTETTPAAQLEQILNVLEAISKKENTLSEADYNKAVDEIASRVFSEAVNDAVNGRTETADNIRLDMEKNEQRDRSDWESLLNSDEAESDGKKLSKLYENTMQKETFTDDFKTEVPEQSILDEYNTESASRADKRRFTKDDIIPEMKKFGVTFMKTQVDKLYPIKSYERYAQKQIHGNERIRFKGKESPYVMASNSIDAESRAKHILMTELVDFDADPIGESLADIIGELSYDDYKDFNTYLKLRHSIEWVENNDNKYKPVFASEILNSPKTMKAAINELETKHSDFEGLAKRIYKYQTDLMQAWLVDTGIITQEQADLLRIKYPDYVPFFRQDDTAPPKFRPKKGIANQSNPIMEASGGGQKIYDPIENIMINTSRFVNAAAKNSAMQSVVKIYDEIPGMEHYMAEVVKNEETGKYEPRVKKNTLQNSENKDNSSNTEFEDSSEAEEDILNKVQHAIKLTDGDIVTVLENGKKRYFKVFDKNFLDALDNMRPIQVGAIMRAVASATRTFSALATNSNPVFTLVSNPLKDAQNAFVQSTQKNPFGAIAAIVEAQFEQVKNSEIGKQIGQKRNADYDGTDAYKKYMAMGGEYASAFSSGRNAMKEALNDIKPKKGGIGEKATSAIKFVPRLYGNVADAIETAPRLGEFKYSKNKEGNDVHQAHFDSKNVTLNFGRSGTVGEKINKFVPFYNPSVQGISTMIQCFKNNPLKTSMNVGVMVAMSAIQLMFNKRDEESEEEYKNASSYLKNNYYLIHKKNGQFIKIPKSQEYGIFPSLLERAVEKYAYKNEDAFYNYADYISGALLPSILKTEFPFFDTGAIIGLGTYTSLLENKDFKGSPIVPDYLTDEVPEMQYDEKTSYIARWIGKKLKWSPKKIDYVIKSNTGFLGKINESILHSGEKDWSMGVNTKFTADSLFSTDMPNMFYENLDSAKRQAESYPNSDNDYLSNRFAQASKVLSVLNEMYKEDSKSDTGREIRRAYVNYAKNSKDNPSGLTDEVYNNIKDLYNADENILSLPAVSREIKAKINKEDKSFVFTDAQSLLNYQKDLNMSVDEAYRKLLSDVEYSTMTNSEKADALGKAKTEAVKSVKQFYIENNGVGRMFDEEKVSDITYPDEKIVTQYKERLTYQGEINSKLQSVSDAVAAAVPEKASDYSLKKLQINDIQIVSLDGKTYNISDELKSKLSEAANEEYYYDIERLMGNEINIEDVVGHTSKGKARTSEQADGTKVSLTGKLYNDDGTPRFDELVTAKIIYKAKEKAKESAINKYASEISKENESQSQTFTPRTTVNTSKATGDRVRFTSKRKSATSRRRTRTVSKGGRRRFKSVQAAMGKKSNLTKTALPNTLSPQIMKKAADLIKNPLTI